MRLSHTLFICTSALSILSSAYAEQRVCWGTKTQSIQPLTISLTCARKASTSDDAVNAYLNTLSADDKEDFQDECDGTTHVGQIPSDWLEPPLVAQNGSAYGIYGSWGFEQNAPLASSTAANLYNISMTITLGSCEKKLSAPDWANGFVPSRNNQVIACDNGSLETVAGLSCSAFDY